MLDLDKFKYLYSIEPEVIKKFLNNYLPKPIEKVISITTYYSDRKFYDVEVLMDGKLYIISFNFEGGINERNII